MSERAIDRRQALGLLGAGAAAGALAACSGPSRPHPSSTATPSTTSPAGSATSSGPPTSADWSALSRGLEGTLVRPEDSGFAAAHQLYDPRFDAVQPLAVVRAAGVEDVVESIRFARSHSLALVPRGGGHSYLGASTVSGGLVVDTRGLHSVSYDAGTQTASVGGGAVLIDVYAALAAHGRGLPAGTCPSVGLAGVAMGGGFGVFDRAYGLTCDVVESFDVVLASGETATVDADRSPDLFWALRGGGGGDFAVVTGVRLRTFAAGEVGRWSAAWPWSRATQVITGWQRYLGSAGRDSWANLHLDRLADGSSSVLIIGVCVSGSAAADRDACVAAIGASPSSTTASSHSYLDTVLSLAGCTSTGPSCHLPPAGSLARESFVAGSSVARASVPSSGAAALVAAVDDVSSWRGERHAVCDPLGGAVAAVSTSATAFPWRSAPFTVQWYANLPLSHPAGDVRAAGSWVAAARARFAPYAMGAYINYPSADVTDRATYHGASYARLQQVKAMVDPGGFLKPPTGVPG